MIPQDIAAQENIATKLNLITVRTLAIEQLQENIEELQYDLLNLFKENGSKMSKNDVKDIVGVWVNDRKIQRQEEEKLSKAKEKLTKVGEYREELSVLDRFRDSDAADKADEYLG